MYGESKHAMIQPFYPKVAMAANTIVKLDTVANTIDKAIASDEKIVGILLQEVKLNPDNSVPKCSFDVLIGNGIASVKIGAAVVAGVYLTSDANGFAVPAAAGDYVIGQALHAATTVGQEVPVHVFKGKV
jgi:hypothetical protein